MIGDSGGEVISTFSSPWAKDANGKPVPTSYRLEGNVPVQTIQTDTSTAYPVVADPKHLELHEVWRCTRCRLPPGYRQL